MENQFAHSFFERRPIVKSKTPSVKWFKEWVPQDVVATGGKCMLLKWVTESQLKALKEKAEEPLAPEPEPEPEPTTEMLFLCTFEGCAKTFVDDGAIRKHAQTHGERQHVCHYKGCGKKFLDSSKLKRHFLTHTGERDYICPYEGCDKAFSLDFNLRSHMKTHSQENYFICRYPDCGKRYAHEYKLRNHIASYHEKNPTVEVATYATPPEKVTKVSKTSASAQGSTSANRPFVCPYEGCGKDYIHKYKLNLHLRREHPDHTFDENPKPNTGNDMDTASDQDANMGKQRLKTHKQSRPKPNLKMPPTKIAKQKRSSPASTALPVMKRAWPAKEEIYEEEDSEETEEEYHDNTNGWRYTVNNEEDNDEETEYED